MNELLQFLLQKWKKVNGFFIRKGRKKLMLPIFFTYFWIFKFFFRYWIFFKFRGFFWSMYSKSKVVLFFKFLETFFVKILIYTSTFSRPINNIFVLSSINAMTFHWNTPMASHLSPSMKEKLSFLSRTSFTNIFCRFFLFVFFDLQLELFARTTMKFSCEFLTIFALIGFISGSLIDYKACQQKSNCTQLLTQADCPDGEFLDTQFKRGCCHGCRKGLGKLFFRFKSLKNREKFLKVVEKAAAALHGPAKNVHRDSNAMKSTFIAFTIDVKRNFFFLFACPFPFQPFTFSIVFTFVAFRRLDWLDTEMRNWRNLFGAAVSRR